MGGVAVTLLKREGLQITFLMEKRERDLLVELLKEYPVLRGAHFAARISAADEERRKNHELLEEALAEQQKENRRRFEEMLKDSKRFQESELGFSITLSHMEIDSLLQMLNDIRVGSWVRLGQPGLENSEQIEVNEKNVRLAWGMEIAGQFEHAFLRAVESS